MLIGIYSDDLYVPNAAITGDSILKKYANSNRVVCIYHMLEINLAKVLKK